MRNANYKNVIAELRKKPINWDKNYTDVLGIEEGKRNKANTIEIPKDSQNPVYKFLSQWGVKLLIGRKAFCLNDRKEIMSGHIVKVLPPHYLLLKDKGVARFSDVVSLEA